MDYGIKRAGADDYLPKPVSRDTLLEALEKVK
jgi:YesN/AraC family two-component response regulator